MPFSPPAKWVVVTASQLLAGTTSSIRGFLSVIVSAAADQIVQLIIMYIQFFYLLVFSAQPGISMPSCLVGCCALFPYKPYPKCPGVSVLALWPFPQLEILVLQRWEQHFDFLSFISSEGIKGKPANTHFCEQAHGQEKHNLKPQHMLRKLLFSVVILLILTILNKTFSAATQR